MAARNAKPKNSSDSEGETEWTFIDSDEGTIETRKDSVTYRKATYSEILKGVAEEDLVQEVDSEPEFEVLASFKFRPKGESFGLGSSALKPATDPKSQGQKNKHDEDEEESSRDDSSSSDDGIMILSSHFDGHHDVDETNENNSSTIADGNDGDECSGNDGDSKVIKPDYCHKDEEHAAASVDDAKDDDDDDDDDFVLTDDVEFEEASVNNAPETDDENDGNDDVTDDDNDDQLDEDVESDEEKLAESKPSIKESTGFEKNTKNEESDVETLGSDDSNSGFLGIHKGGLCDNPNKDLDWDSFTFQLLCTLPRISDSTTTIDDDNEQDNLHHSDSEDTSQSSYVAISQDDKEDESSSFDELSDSADVNNDFRSDPMIPLWLFDADHNVGNVVESTDDDTDYIMSSVENLNFEESSLIIPQWFFDTNFKKENTDSSFDDDFEHIKPKKDEVDFEKTNPAIPNWLFDPNYKAADLEESYDDYHTEYTDSEYDSESDLDDSSALTLPRWLFVENFRPSEKDEDSFFSTSHLFVDIPTFIILLCLTTALGFTIGHGLTVYFGGQGISRNTKLQDLKTPPKQFANPLEELGLTAEEIAKIDLLKLEEELYRQKESDMLSEHLRFDLRELYKTLQKKHYRLLRNQKSTEDRLHISKTMSWYWRLKYDEEKRRNRKTSLQTKLRPKNFTDMATLAMKTKLEKKWRQLRKNRTSLGLKNTKFMKTNLKWLLNPLDVKLKRQENNKTKAEFESRFWRKASALNKSNDMKNFKRRWTQDFKDLKRVSCPYLNKSTLLKKKSLIIYNPFSWVNNSQHCKRANKNDILARCLKKGQPLDRKTRNDSTGDKQAEKEIKALKFKPCFSKPKTVKIAKRSRKESISVKNRNRFSPGKSVMRTSKKGERTQLSDRQDEIHRERLRKRELKRKSVEVKNQVKELKLVLAELRRERRKAEKEKAELETSWRKLKRQRLQFEKEMVKQTQKNRKKVKKVKSKLKREKTRLRAWKKVTKRARKEALALSKDLKRVSLAKKKMQDIRNIKKELKLEKRKLRKQRNDLIFIKQQLRKEHRNYSRERWKIKKKQRELESQKRSQSETVLRKEPQVKKRGKTRKKRSKKKRQGERPSTKGSQEKKRKPNKQKRFWDNLEKSLYEWVKKINRTVEHHSQGKASKLWEKFRNQIGKLINWSTGKSSKPTGPVKKEKHHSKIKVKQKNPVLEKILAEQMRFDEEKRNARKKDSEDQWKSKGPTINKERKTPNGLKRKKERKKKDSDALMKQRQRKQRRKYQRELERLQQWALQMNEKKLEHDRIYRDKEKKQVQSLKSRQNANHDKEELKKRTKQVGSIKENRALVTVEDSNSTLMLLLQPQVSDKSYKSQKVRKKEKAGTQDKEEIIFGVTRSQLMHELGKKKRADTSLTLPVNDDIIQLPKDVIKGVKADYNLGMSSFREDEPSSRPEPKPPSLAPTFYEDFPIIKVIENANVATKEDSVDVAKIFAPNGLKGDGNGQRTEPWYMLRAEQREVFRNTNPSMALFPRPIGPLKSDGTWFFHRSSDRALQRKLYEPLNSQNQRDGFKHSSRRSYFHRGGLRDAVKDGKWVFDRASDRAKQRSNNEPWFMRRADGRKKDREENKDSWFIERGFDRDQLHDYDEDDVDDDLMNYYDDYDDYGDHDFDEHYDSWL